MKKEDELRKLNYMIFSTAIKVDSQQFMRNLNTNKKIMANTQIKLSQSGDVIKCFIAA